MTIVENYLFQKEKMRRSKLENYSTQTDPEPPQQPTMPKIDKEKMAKK